MKKLSILMQMRIRFFCSVLYLFVLYLYSSSVFRLGSIQDIELKSGWLLFVLITGMVLAIVAQTECTYLYCDPANKQNLWKYRTAFTIQVLLLVFHSALLMRGGAAVRGQGMFWSVYLAAAAAVLGMHLWIMHSYSRMSDEIVDQLILDYKLEWNEALHEKSRNIRIRAYYFLGYLIAAALTFQYMFLNPFVLVVFCMADFGVMAKLFRDSLGALWELEERKGNVDLILLIQSVCAVLARVLLYLIGDGRIYLWGLSGRSGDELGMVFILCYIPLYHQLIRCYTMEVRMEREWVR